MQMLNKIWRVGLMKLHSVLVTLFFVIVIVATFLFVSELKADDAAKPPLKIIPIYRTDGSVTFSVLTVTNHGQYTPRNIGAIWVTTESGTFVKTLQRWGNSYLQYLTKWHFFSSSGNVTGAVTGATLSSHSTHNVTWNCKNTSNVEVPDGNYKIWVEYTESNGTGPNTSVTFTKGPSTVHLTPANVTYFQNMVLNFTPTITVSAPQNLIGNIVNNAQVNLRWSEPTSTYGLTGYKLYRDNPLLVSIDNTTTLTYLDTPELGSHDYYVTAMFGTSESTASNTVSLTLTANHDATQTSYTTALEGNYPNPFNPETTIRFSLAKTQYASLSIYNYAGQKVRTITSGNLAAGDHIITWNGTNDRGNTVASGFYLYKLETRDKTIIKKMVMLK